MKQFFLIIAVSAILITPSCKSKKPVFEKLSYTVLEQQMKFDMLYLPVKKTSKVALIIPSPFEDFNSYDNPLTRSLYRSGYNIVVAPTHEEIKSLTKRAWSEGIIATYQTIVNDSILSADPENFVIIGMEDGGYILPEVSNRLKPDLFIAVNSGSHSPLEEMITALGDTAIDNQPFVKAYDAIDEEELLIKTEILLREPYRDAQLGNRSNSYWISFYEDPAYERLIRGTRPGSYLIFESYPLISKSSIGVLQQVLPKEPNRRVDVIQIPGNGDLKDAENLELLTSKIKDLISSPH